MSQANYNDTVRALDALRARTQSYSTSIAKLIHDITTTSPLPTPTSISNSWNLFNHNLQSLHEILLSEKYAPHLKAGHVHPTPSYPGRTLEELLTQLVRKKNQPAVEDWISEGKTLFDKQLAMTEGVSTTGVVTGLGLKLQELEEVWNWAGMEANRIAREEIGAEGWDDVFTLAETEAGIEDVVTGLRRKLWESEDEASEDEDGDSSMEIKKEKEKKGNDIDVDDKDVRSLDGFDQATRTMMSRKFEEAATPLPLETVLRLQLTGQFVVRR